MQYQITSDNMQVSASMENLAKQKLARVEHRFRDVSEDAKTVRIVLNTAPEGMFQAKIQLNIDGKEYFSDETEYSLETALIRTVEEILQMIEKDTDRVKRIPELTAADLMEVAEEEEDVVQ